LIKREVQKKINTYLNSKEVILITGVRRSGKSSLMRLITEDIITKSKVSYSNIWIKNYEEVRDDKF
jgi:predicted AAA+ superfamily ATPase